MGDLDWPENMPLQQVLPPASVVIGVSLLSLPLITLGHVLRRVCWGGVRFAVAPLLPCLLLAASITLGGFHVVFACLLLTRSQLQERVLTGFAVAAAVVAVTVAIYAVLAIPRALDNLLQLQSRLVEVRALLSVQRDASPSVYQETSGPLLNFSQAHNLSVKHLFELIKDVLQLSRCTKCESERLTLVQEEFELHTVLRQVANFWTNGAKAKNVRFKLRLSHRLPALAIGDPSLLCQLLNQLLDNAVKVTATGLIRMDCDMLLPEPVAPQERLDSKLFENRAGSSSLDRAVSESARTTLNGQAQPAQTQTNNMDNPVFLLQVRIVDAGQRFNAHQINRSETSEYRPLPHSRTQREREICFSWARNLTTALGGTMTTKSYPGAGTCVLLSLPLKSGRLHLTPSIPSKILQASDKQEKTSDSNDIVDKQDEEEAFEPSNLLPQGSGMLARIQAFQVLGWSALTNAQAPAAVAATLSAASAPPSLEKGPATKTAARGKLHRSSTKWDLLRYKRHKRSESQTSMKSFKKHSKSQPSLHAQSAPNAALSPPMPTVGRRLVREAGDGNMVLPHMPFVAAEPIRSLMPTVGRRLVREAGDGNMVLPHMPFMAAEPIRSLSPKPVNGYVTTRGNNDSAQKRVATVSSLAPIEVHFARLEPCEVVTVDVDEVGSVVEEGPPPSVATVATPRLPASPQTVATPPLQASPQTVATPRLPSPQTYVVADSPGNNFERLPRSDSKHISDYRVATVDGKHNPSKSEDEPFLSESLPALQLVTETERVAHQGRVRSYSPYTVV
eukprot:g66060.t1